MRQLLIRFSRDEDGATAVEYGAIIPLIAITIIGALVLLDVELTAQWQRILEAMS